MTLTDAYGYVNPVTLLLQVVPAIPVVVKGQLSVIGPQNVCLQG